MPGAFQPGRLALASVKQIMATTLATVEAREVLRCDHCSLVQFRTIELTLQALPQAPRNGRARTTRPATGNGIESVPYRRIGSRCRQCGARYSPLAQAQPAAACRTHAGAAHLHLENRKRQGRCRRFLHWNAWRERWRSIFAICCAMRAAASMKRLAAVLADSFLREIAPYMCQDGRVSALNFPESGAGHGDGAAEVGVSLLTPGNCSLQFKGNSGGEIGFLLM